MTEEKNRTNENETALGGTECHQDAVEAIQVGNAIAAERPVNADAVVRSGNAMEFNDKEREFIDMISQGAKLVGDKWFEKSASAVEMAKYLVSYSKRMERNARRREKYLGRIGEERPRNVRAPISIDEVSQHEYRLALERRKCNRRATFGKCPTANEIRAAWHFRLDSDENRLRLGGMLLDLEAYVDNSLKTLVYHRKLLIYARNPGMLGWIRENCPELECKYKTMMRYRSMAKRFRQELDVVDPVPASWLLPGARTPSRSELQLQIQPRDEVTDDERGRREKNGAIGCDENHGDDHVEKTTSGSIGCASSIYRFAWEHGIVHSDAKGRLYRDNGNYMHVSHRITNLPWIEKQVAKALDLVTGIILNRTVFLTNENYSSVPPRGVRLEWGCGDGYEVLKRRRGGKSAVGEVLDTIFGMGVCAGCDPMKYFTGGGRNEDV